MIAGVPSRTALGVALRRAAHQILDVPLVFEDPIATKIVGGITDRRALHGRVSRTLRAFLAARSRYAEDQLAAFYAEKGTQYVVLGAGLDTFAYRNPFSSTLCVFEVDHPYTQAWKRELLRSAGIPVPDSLTFLPVDFEKQGLAEAFESARGFGKAKKTFFSWLGVTPYLTRDAFETTLQFIASLPRGSAVVFDYAAPPSSLTMVDRIALRVLALRVARAGETFRLFLDRQELSALVRGMGFTRMEDLGQDQLNARYFDGRSDGLSIQSAIGRLVTAIKH